MCGIVGAVSQRNVVPLLVDGLARLEYRGYDSAGIAVIGEHEIRRVRAVGRVAEMQARAEQEQLAGSTGIGHTRWATHGGVTEANAHPHVSRGDIAVVHNGIIENHEEQRARLSELGYVFESQTDTEVIAHLIQHYFSERGDLFHATLRAMRDLKGAYAIAAMSRHLHGRIAVARNGCPLLIGLGEGENFIASDVSALLSATRRVIYLEDGDAGVLTHNAVLLTDRNGDAIERRVHISEVSLSSLDLGPYNHYMQKEIYEQPQVLADSIRDVVQDDTFSAGLFGADAPGILGSADSVLILAAGTSYYAGLTAKYWLESIARLPTSVEISSEYRYRSTVPHPRQLVVTISQSGETADTLEALKQAEALGQRMTLSICNVRESAIPRASALAFYTRAGAEIGVASTKAFTTQLAALFILTATLAKLRGLLDRPLERQALDGLGLISGVVQHALNLEPQIRDWARTFASKEHTLFLGRGIHYPIALEGALKLKEISYIHAEAYPAGELKHGPLALVDERMPVVVLAPSDTLLEKVKSNMQEVRARGGQLYVLTDPDSAVGESEGVHVIRTPRSVGMLSPILYSIPVQLLAYQTALLRGTDVDKPRNLAKSVTVE